MTTPRAYYNDNDPRAAAWLRELIAANLIAPGEVDERSIEQVTVDDLRGFIQCHFFAGIGVWSYALRLAGWPDARPVWTGSCPCPPFSAAGKNQTCPQCSGTNPVPHVGRTGFFVCCLCQHEWFADARHLWPELWRLIRDGRPDAFFGEQVAAADGRVWLASVRASLEILGFTVGAADICAAGVGAPHIRQRLWFVADTTNDRWAEHEHEPGRRATPESDHPTEREGTGASAVADTGSLREGSGLRDREPGEQWRLLATDNSELGDTESGGLREHRGAPRDSRHPAQSEPVSNMDDTDRMQPEFITRSGTRPGNEEERRPRRQPPGPGETGRGMGNPESDDQRRLSDRAHRPREQAGGPSSASESLADAKRDGRRADEQGRRSQGRETDGRAGEGLSRPLAHADGRDTGDGELQRSGRHGLVAPDATSGFWSDVEWLYCKDGKYRPTKPGLFPLAHGITGRVGLLRGAGNAIVAQVAQAFIEAYMSLERE